MRKIDWTPDGVNSLNEILEYYHDKAGENVANNIYPFTPAAKTGP